MVFVSIIIMDSKCKDADAYDLVRICDTCSVSLLLSWTQSIKVVMLMIWLECVVLVLFHYYCLTLNDL